MTGVQTCALPIFFLINVPVMFLVLAAGPRLLPELRNEREGLELPWLAWFPTRQGWYALGAFPQASSRITVSDLFAHADVDIVRL